MTLNRLLRETIDEEGKTVIKMKTFEIDVIAKSSGGLAPTLIYLYDHQDVTDDIRAIRFGHPSPYSYIEDYDQFQKMLYQKEEQAINDLYDSFSIRPKNMSTGKQILWSFGVLLIMSIPFLVALFIF